MSRLTPSLTASGTDAVLTVTYSHDGIELATAPFTVVLDGLGIASVAKSGDTVTVTYDDGTTDDFTVNGVSNVVKTVMFLQLPTMIIRLLQLMTEMTEMGLLVLLKAVLQSQ